MCLVLPEVLNSIWPSVSRDLSSISCIIACFLVSPPQRIRGPVAQKRSGTWTNECKCLRCKFSSSFIRIHCCFKFWDIESGCVQEFLEDTGTNREISVASAAAFGFATSTGRHGAGVESKHPWSSNGWRVMATGLKFFVQKWWILRGFGEVVNFVFGVDCKGLNVFHVFFRRAGSFWCPNGDL